MSKLPVKKYRLPDLLWWLKRDLVFEEISKMMGIDNVDTYEEGWFNYRVGAIKNVLTNMPEAEKDELRRQGDKMAEMGLPEDLKQK